MFSWHQNLPLHIDPIAFTVGSFSVRWYALSYIVGFLTVYFILMWRVRKDDINNIYQIFNFQFSIFNKNPKSKIQKKIRDTKYEIRNTILDFLLVAFFSALIGGRIGYVLLYNFTYFINNPISIIWPFENGNFVGLYGMSYHGGLVGVLIGSWIFLRVKKINFLAWADFVVPVVPLGYFFGRIGNFLNGELYGRITNSSLGMHFANNQTVLRHPSQIYEAVLEGLLLFAILWKLRNKKLPAGCLLAIYLMGYGILRIIGEQFREPDPQIGLLLNFFTLGQFLSVGMIFLGAGILVLKKLKR